jgi:hypothetical protein
VFSKIDLRSGYH